MNDAQKTISKHLAALPVNSNDYEALVRCYILARLRIKHAKRQDYDSNTISSILSKTISHYHLQPSPQEQHYIDSPAFIRFCKDLETSGMDTDYRCFFNIFAPYIVADWKQLESYFSVEEHGQMLYVLYLILKITNDSKLEFSEINTDQLELYYSDCIALCGKMSISKDSFIGCWYAVYRIPMPELTGTVSRNLAVAIRFYRQHKVSALQLVANYCQYNKHRAYLDEAFNPWMEFEHTVKGKPNTVSGVSIAESAFNLVENIRNEKPTDVIRAALYPFPALFGHRSDLKVKSSNDGRFECSFFMQQFEELARSASNILIVNPGPDFLLAWSQKVSKYDCKCCIAVPNKYIAAAYRMEFRHFQFCIFSDIADYANRFDLIAIVSTLTSENLSFSAVLSSAGDNANIIATLPQTTLSRTDEAVGNTLRTHGFQVTKLVAIAPQATVTKPGKKMLLWANNRRNHSDQFPVFFTQCDKNASSIIIEKKYICITHDQLNKPTTLIKLRNDFEKSKIDQSKIKHRSRPNIYHFSDEITLLYTVHRDKHNVLVGEAYYRGKTDPESTTNRKPWNSPATQKGLRCKESESMLTKLENVPYSDVIRSYIVGDILDYYNAHFHQCSLKTIWFCCRDNLLTRRDYNDEIARNILFSCETTKLSVIRPTSASNDDYRTAMQAVIPDDSIAIVKYWQQLNLIMKIAVENGFLHFNPIPELLPEVSKRASKQLRNIRNMLTKKTLTFDEEAAILAYVRGETDTAFGTRNALRFEVDSTLLLGPIHLFTGMSTREACALTWDDFKKISGLHAYQLSVWKFILDDGSYTYQLDGKTSKYTYRKIPVAPLLADMINSRKNYMKTVLGFSERELQSLPIIMTSNAKNPTKHTKSPYCKYDDAIRICRMLVEKANIPTQELLLPGNGEEIVVDMNKYHGDIFYTNFRHRANHTCGLNRGELSYVVGNKAPDTFSQHYCDYANDLVQYSMVQKLNRWTYRHALQVESVPPITSNVSTFIRSTTISANHNGAQYNTLSITLSSAQKAPGSYIDITIECDHGVTGSIAVYSDPRKEDDQL